MKEIWLVCNGRYSDINWHGFFETEREAKEYCEWMNNKCDSDHWNEFWYTCVKSMLIKKEKKEDKIVYRITTNGYVIEECDIEVMLQPNAKNRYIVTSDDDNGFKFIFEIVCDDKNKAIKIAQDTIAQIKEKYKECEDWDLAMSSIGGHSLI